MVSLATAAALVVAAALFARRGDRRPLVAMGWVAIAFLPASNLLVPTGQLLAERTLYLPSVGVALLAAWGIDRVYGWARDARGAFTAQLATGVPAAALALGGLLVAYPSVIPWQDELHAVSAGDPDGAARVASVAAHGRSVCEQG